MFEKNNAGIPRNEYPRPQFVRKNWLNLNGVWDFEYDNAKNGIAKGLFNADANYSLKINVPFCPQSSLSGIQNTDFIYGVWYRRNFALSENELRQRVVLHFGAVDYKATVFVNGKNVGEHIGGYSSFSFDITDFCVVDANTLAVFAEDDERSVVIPSGKQSRRFNSFGCSYTRTTGIWQTVWLEFTPKSYIQSIKYITNPTDGSVTLICRLVGSGTVCADVFYDGKDMGHAAEYSDNGTAVLKIELTETHLWELGAGRLYKVELRFGEDEAASYFGLRSVALKDGNFLLNNKVVFQRLVLDQGFYSDGIYTAPSDSALEKDILLSMSVGFNGARLHQKVFEERFLYYCDLHGYIVWGEYPDWGTKPGFEHLYAISNEWTEVLQRDFNHPAVIGWCPRNECDNKDYIPAVKYLYTLTKALDPTRPCIDTSGYVHTVTDIFDEHFYNQNPQVLRERYSDMVIGEIVDRVDSNRKWNGEPFFVSEFGGIKWCDESDKSSWGYGDAPADIEAFYERFAGLCNAIMDSPKIMGFCYTQLTDVEQEKNGIFKYDRSQKFDSERLKRILSRQAENEK